MELTGGRLVAAGHLGYEKLFADENIDFFQSPGTYWARDMGEGSGFMCADGTRKSYGKGWLHEIDHFTYMCDPKVNKNIPITGFPGDENRWKTPSESCAGLKREISLAIVNDVSMWFFDMVGGWFNSEEMMQTIERGYKIFEENQGKCHKSVAEIALIADAQSAMYINDFNHLVNAIYPRSRNILNKVGAPFDVYSFNDIGRVDMSQYKFFVFPASFKIDSQRLVLLKKHIFKDGKISLFMYAPAIIDENSLDSKNVKKFVGVDYATKGVQKVKRDSYSLVYIHNYSDFNVNVARTLAEEAGVHMVSKKGDVVYANEKFVCVHTGDSGKREIRLPFKCKEVVEVFSKRIVAKHSNVFLHDFSSGDTALFEMGK